MISPRTLRFEDKVNFTEVQYIDYCKWNEIARVRP